MQLNYFDAEITYTDVQALKKSPKYRQEEQIRPCQKPCSVTNIDRSAKKCAYKLYTKKNNTQE